MVFGLPSPFKKKGAAKGASKQDETNSSEDGEDGEKKELTAHEKIAAQAEAEMKNEVKKKTDEQEAEEAMKLSKGDNPTKNNLCTSCISWLCRCGRKTKEE